MPSLPRNSSRILQDNSILCLPTGVSDGTPLINRLWVWLLLEKYFGVDVYWWASTYPPWLWWMDTGNVIQIRVRYDLPSAQHFRMVYVGRDRFGLGLRQRWWYAFLYVNNYHVQLRPLSCSHTSDVVITALYPSDINALLVRCALPFNKGKTGAAESIMVYRIESRQ